MITRFAPSPTGPLHLGHAYSAMFAHDMAKAASGTFLLRIEDIDGSRARPAWEEQVYNDLRWLGLSWPEPVMRQSERLPIYREALQKLWDQWLLFPCDCSRRDIQEGASAPQEGAPAYGPDGLIYPGTCKSKPRPEAMPDAALRLDMGKAARDVSYLETCPAPQTRKTSSETFVSSIGDVVLARRDMGTSYHLSVVIDDAAQGVTDVVRGADLAEATPIHVLLQKLLDLPTPSYHHHRLIRDGAGRRLAKRDDARAIRKYREEGATPADIRQMVGLPAV
ncbi:tRNA glutamyl-Q(34) synthetase GluQRS [Cognatiyoonia sp. IB215446]|uniref:tRNA glutamyl-Q(34) synthetase GluQRS n=1 Tax=Cognatiyoonia sp. IB215446 TaxID=3097355 RepID=UPI002A0B3B96|nr:tRNA glutamyl-Q(34) synthetase GluQRS [Cognatiyoonia sp. IB215446]MDX8348684.1 tRNA glutamyl-Q(34) synthetase GluQRS [Cognatiyoonia sp. IB215446]